MVWLSVCIHPTNFFSTVTLRSLVDHSSPRIGSALRGPARKKSLSVAFGFRDPLAVPLRASLGWASHL